jgi:hypothetical protein
VLPEKSANSARRAGEESVRLTAGPVCAVGLPVRADLTRALVIPSQIEDRLAAGARCRLVALCRYPPLTFLHTAPSLSLGALLLHPSL